MALEPRSIVPLQVLPGNEPAGNGILLQFYYD